MLHAGWTGPYRFLGDRKPKARFWYLGAVATRRLQERCLTLWHDEVMTARRAAFLSIVFVRFRQDLSPHASR